ncbi:hypothetical protein QWZ13_10270 [Reinekea marina]|nr:hypothetical protein [Reinekea marina]MDN3649298.1 hypothetical protein [Reinekea marina]
MKVRQINIYVASSLHSEHTYKPPFFVLLGFVLTQILAIPF